MQIQMNRQRSVFISLMNTMTKSTELYGQALSSSGTMTEIQEKYMESFNGKLGTLKATFESLATNSLNSDFMKGAIDGLTTFVNVLDSSVSKFGVLPTVLTTTIPIVTMFNSKMRETVDSIGRLSPTYTQWSNSLKQNQLILSEQVNGIKRAITAVETQRVKTIQAGQSTVAYDKALSGLNSKLTVTTASLIGTKIATIALQTALSMGIGLAISAVISGVTALGKALFSTSETMESCSSQASELSTALNNIGSDEDLVTQYEELNDKIKENVQSADEVKTLNEQIAQVKAQLGADDDYYWVLNDEKLTLEQQLDLIKQIRAEKLKDQAEELDKEMPSKNNINNKSDQLELDVVQWQKLTDAIANADANGQTMYDGHTVSAEAMKGVLEEVEGRIKSNSIEIQTYNGNLKLMEEAGVKTSRSEVGMSDAVNDVTSKINAQTQAINENTNAKDSNGNVDTSDSGIGDVDTATSQSSVSALESVYKSLGYTVDEASARVAELNALSSEDQSAEVIKDATTAYGKAIDKTKEYTEMLNEVNELTSMTPDMISQLASKYPELGASITDVASVQEFLNNKISESVQAQADAYEIMAGDSETYYSQLLQNSESLQDNFNKLVGMFVDNNQEAYTVDVNNFKTLNEAKNALGNNLNSAMAQWISNMVGGNAQGYETDLANMNTLAQKKVTKCLVCREICIGHNLKTSNP